MPKVSFKMCHPFEEIWNETLNVPEKVQPEEYISQIIEDFNNTLRPGEKSRMCIEYTVLSEVADLPHVWKKLSLVTEKGGYDKMECEYCGRKAKRYGFNRLQFSGSNICPKRK